VEGRGEVHSIVSGVTASLELLREASAAGADAILVHHGYFWKGEDARLTGARRARIALLLEREINLFAYHLPLDAHAELGNNARLGAVLGWIEEGRSGEDAILAYGRVAAPVSLSDLGADIAARLGREPLLIGDPQRQIARIAWCSGAAQAYFEQSAALGVDAFLTGEISEQNVHLARETGVAFIAAGHHATEKYGVQAVGAHLAARFGLQHRFIDVPNPV